MSDVTGERLEGGWYQIRIRGHLEPRWATWFDGMAVTSESGGNTLIEGQVMDQAALYGILQRTRDVGLPLVSVTHVDAPVAHPPGVKSL